MRAAWLAGSLILALTAPALAAKKAEPAPSMEIEAKTTTYDGKAHTYQMRGQVRITLPQMIVTCDEATVHAAVTEDQVLRVVFAGHVEAKRGTDTFRAERITYHVQERRLVAEGGTRTQIKLPTGASGPITGP